MTKFDHSFVPPAPIAKIKLKRLDSSEVLGNVRMLLDTGSDITLLPISSLDSLGVQPVSERPIALFGFDGQISESEIYRLQILFLGKRFTGNYCSINDSVGIIGRDILNQIALVYDGPNLEWNEYHATLPI